VGGVKLNLQDAEAVEEAFESIKTSVSEKAGAEHFLGCTVQPMVKMEGYELIVGSSIDPQFGPVLLFGTGGQLVEVFKDRALGLPPLNTTIARRMIERTKISTALKGVRGRPPVDMDALEKLLVRFSQLIAEQRWIKELDINPLIASHEGILALDARVVLYTKDVPKSALPKLAIRPYPNKYVAPWTMKDGREVIIRPIRAEDEPLISKFHESLSDRTVYLRYLSPMLLSERVTHERLARMTHNDYDREIALVVEGEENDERAIYAVARLSKFRGEDDEARLSMLVSDRFQGQGLGKELIKRLIDVARNEQIKQIVAGMSPENATMRALCRKVGFSTITTNPATGMVEAVMTL
jgi:acetyltransferase